MLCPRAFSSALSLTEVGQNQKPAHKQQHEGAADLQMSVLSKRRKQKSAATVAVTPEKATSSASDKYTCTPVKEGAPGRRNQGLCAHRAGSVL